jgi:site-specific recombinase XerD
MSPTPPVHNVNERYDRNLRYANKKRALTGQPQPRPTAEWPPENRELLARYERWLLGGGTSQDVTHRLYLPAAGHVLGLFLRPHTELVLPDDLQPALAYVKAKRSSVFWINACQNALDRFQRFLLQERGIQEITITPYDHVPHTQGLPDWLVQELKNYQLVRQRNWRSARLEDNIRRFWSGYLRTWRFLCEQCGVVVLADLERQHIFAYMEHRLEAGYAPSGINNDVRSLQGFLGFLQNQGYAIPQSLFRIPGLKPRQPLPKFLTDAQVRLLRDDLEAQVDLAAPDHLLREALLFRAAFYLLWQGGLRLGELEELLVEDLDLENRKLSVRQSKSMADRTIYLTDTVVSVLLAYLERRGTGSSEHVFLYRNRALRKDLVRARIKAAGRRVGVKVYPHRLRHTCATQLLNAGCRVTSIQRFLGHKRLNTTMVYAKVHDHQVAEDYYAAMEQIEKHLDLAQAEQVKVPLEEAQRGQLLALTDQLAVPELPRSERLELVAQLRWLLEPQSVIE